MTKVVGRVSRYTSLRSKTGEVKYFGSVSVTETQEYSFYTNGILGNESLIKPGVFVIFELEHQKDKSEPEAINIELVTKNSDLETLSICVKSNKDRLWLRFFKRYLKLAIRQNENKDQLIKLCIKKLNLIKILNPSAKQDKSEFERGTEKKIDFLKSIPSRLYLESKELLAKLEQLTTEDYLKLYNNIPIRLYVESKNLRNKLYKLMLLRTLTIDAHLNIYDQIYQESIETEKREEIVDEVSKYITYFSEDQQNSIIHLLPNNLKRESKIFQSFKPKVQVDSIWNIFKADQINVWEQLSKEAKKYSLYRAFEEQVCIDNLINKFSIEIVNELSQDIMELSEKEQNTLIHLLPNNLKRESKIFQSFKPKVQVDSIWNIFQADPINVWERLSKKAKIYSLYRAFEEQVCIDNLINNISQDDDALISFAINLFSHNKISFWEIHKSLLKLIINCQGETSLISPFLDGYNPGYNIFNSPLCYTIDLDNLKDLRLENFLANKNVDIAFSDGTRLNPEDYIRKIQEWMNFIRRNSNRLKCSYCQKFMDFDPKYTKYSRIYAITVFHCPDSVPSHRVDDTSGLDGSNHNYNVYINHCWKCGTVVAVDSRDSFRVYGKDYRDQGWVRCANCGAGKKTRW